MIPLGARDLYASMDELVLHIRRFTQAINEDEVTNAHPIELMCYMYYV